MTIIERPLCHATLVFLWNSYSDSIKTIRVILTIWLLTVRREPYSTYHTLMNNVLRSK